MSSFAERLVDELIYIVEKQTLLHKFINSGNTENISPKMLELMTEQHLYMCQYRDSLSERIVLLITGEDGIDLLKKG